MAINRTASTLAVLIACPLVTAVLFFLPICPLAAAFVIISFAYLIVMRPIKRSGYLCTLRPAAVYFIMLYIPAVFVSNQWSPVPYPLTFCLAIAASSLLCRASYTFTSDLERREALDIAECAIRTAIAHPFQRRKDEDKSVAAECTIAPALAMLMSFIPLVRRAWCEVDEARRSRDVLFITPSMLAALISCCMKEAMETQEALEARE